ncbi:probable multidrug resistance-associated protein lethal(2)03659 isoform X2 [Anoplophora glabripennis]|uniref:probable multidrug resistance-associated protein lethal(2)03659 isoform X2 n=1 Tax=Anoplophora glabripennis TaxID=217634 RepID=UPI000873EFB1|nr:probable multidrug resistance-associated protein lethal(2)03659 isoform X2 [Anoplophora glabripennis]
MHCFKPIVLAEYIHYYDLSTQESRPETGWLLGSCVVLMAFLNVVIMHYASVGCQRIGMRVRTACCSLVYRKLLKLSQTSLGQTAAGQLVNLLSNDVQRFDMAANFLHYAWIMPIQAVIAFYIMYRSVGYAAIAGMLAITLESIPLQGYMSRLQGKWRYHIALRTDNRVKLMNEITTGVQVIKMYAWEKPFEKVIELARRLEIDVVRKTSYIRGVSVAIMVFTERVTLYLTIITYVLLGNRLTGDVVFSMAQLFNTVQLYMSIFYPMAISSYAEADVSIKRLEKFLLLEENTDIAVANEQTISDIEKKGTVRIVKVNASWLPNPIVDTLMNINLDIAPGTLCCVVGNVGSGKSSLLQLLLRELPLNAGRVDIGGSISYASQESWLFVSSVRNNILFGRPYIKNRYKDVVKVCALERDFEQFPHGDKTLVGERGVSLSGGQRARINLARAVYADADIYLLDDPLSAVDTHVGKHLFHECFKKYLKDKTRILVTHQLQFLKEADIIVIINNGRIEKICTYSELSKTELGSLNQENAKENEKENIQEDHRERVQSVTSVRRERLQSVTSVGSSLVNEDEPQETDELIEKGAIPTSTYLEYCRAGGTIFLLLFLFFLLIIAQMASNASDLWVTYWTNMEELRYQLTPSENLITGNLTNNFNITTTETPSIINDTLKNVTNQVDITSIGSRDSYIIIYTIFIIGSIILTTARSLLYYKICMTASINLHNKMFSNVLQAPMRFFDTNPSGRILNRFSKDMGAVDELLPRAGLDALQIFLVMFGILVMVFIVTPWMVAPAIVLGIIFYYFRLIYLETAQDVKRLEGTTKAPVFSHISATLYGMPTIRSSKAERMITREFDVLQDQHTSTWFMFFVSSEAFGFFLDIISTIFLAMVTYQFLIFRDENTLSGNVGLVISQSLILTGMLQFGVRQTAEVTSNMTSVERVLQYTKLDKEGPFESLPTNKPDRNWPNSGKVVFTNVYVRYTLEDPPVLKNLNMEINQAEKVGIVGRTGAGKSTLIASLFRLAPIEGKITIDDVDTSAIGLNDLRSNISIIPQEPVLFSSSIRYNLDPFEKVTDDMLWQALENVELKTAIDDLNQQVSEGGSNFSAGQRQLICLARAIVRNNKILVMDEATANVDPQTDSLIQKTIRTNFEKCTVITIAHRLNTIMDSDRVLVMDAGQAVEFDHPHQLLQKPHGFFTKMVQQTGPRMEATLRKVAKDDYEKKFGKNVTEENVDSKKDA